MLDAALRWLLPSAALLAIGPLAAIPVAALHGAHGGPDTGFLASSSPMAGLIALVIAAVAVIAVGAIVARLTGLRTALLAAGFVAAWVAWRTGEADTIYRVAPAAGTVLALVADGVLIAIVAFIALAAADRVQRRARHAEQLTVDPLVSVATIKATFTTPSGLAGIGAAAVVALVLAFFAAASPARGQAVFAAFVAAIGAGAAASIASGSLSKEAAPPLAAFIGVLIAMILSPLVVLITPGTAELAEAAVRGAIPGPGRVLAADWLVGFLLGTPVGIGWAGAAIAPEHDHAAHATHA